MDNTIISCSFLTSLLTCTVHVSTYGKWSRCTEPKQSSSASTCPCLTLSLVLVLMLLMKVLLLRLFSFHLHYYLLFLPFFFVSRQIHQLPCLPVYSHDLGYGNTKMHPIGCYQVNAYPDLLIHINSQECQFVLEWRCRIYIFVVTLKSKSIQLI